MVPDDLDRPELIHEAPLSALPSVGARVAAFAAIMIAGICGAMIGFAVVSLQAHGDKAVAEGIGAVVGGVVAAVGVGIIATLVLRAMGEWKTIQEPEREPPARR